MMVHWIVLPHREHIESVSPIFFDLVEQTTHGVDVFFVISGFLIGRILLRRSDERGFLQVFYVRRFFRIIPLYFLIICLFFIGRSLLGLTIGHPDSAIPLWSYFIFINNFFGAMGVQEVVEYGPYWSLAIEEQFYLSSAVLAFFLKRRGVVLLAVLFVAASLITRTAVFLNIIDIGTWQFTLGHADPIGIGLLVAAALENQMASQFLSRHLRFVGFAGVFCFVAFLFTSQLVAGGFIGLDIFLISLTVACWIVHKSLGNPSSWLSTSVLRRVGEMSFSLYIIHEGWRFYAALIAGVAGIPLAVELLLSFAFLLVVCRLLWLYVESPLIALGHTWQYTAKLK